MSHCRTASVLGRHGPPIKSSPDCHPIGVRTTRPRARTVGIATARPRWPCPRRSARRTRWPRPRPRQRIVSGPHLHRSGPDRCPLSRPVGAHQSEHLDSARRTAQASVDPVLVQQTCRLCGLPQIHGVWVRHCSGSTRTASNPGGAAAPPLTFPRPNVDVRERFSTIQRLATRHSGCSRWYQPVVRA